ncbi:MAG TPA: DUF4163 domain-containing protein [Novosphingobium sp.]|nr:DUF4163 domain-containing protein [Novosphingobium sp.]
MRKIGNRQAGRKLRIWPAVAIGLAALALMAPPAQAASAPAHKVEANTALYTFSYEYPQKAEAIAALRAWLDSDAARARREIAASAREGAADARQNGYPFNPYDASTSWQVVTDLPGWLSLSGMAADYTGGAHPNHGPIALLWDKAAGQRRQALDLFASKAAFSAALKGPFCAALNRQRAERRGAAIDPHSTDPFDACLDPAEAVVILGGADHQHFTRIGLLLGPYAAGPYAEGDYEVTLPVSPAVLAAVRPPYRAAFAVGR